MSDRLALIIANSEFDDPGLARLVTPSRDAEALAEVLRDPAIGRFDVTLLVNKTEWVVRREIARLYQHKKRDDLLLMYYSGHGIKDDYGDLYLAVKDTETDIVSATAINAAFVRDRLDKSSSQRKVVVLDCCHSGAFARGAKVALGSSAGTLEAFEGSGYGRVILTASNALEYAWEGDRLLGKTATSVFTHFLVEGLQTGAADLNSDGKISLKELYDYTYEQVLTSGLSKQTPQMSASKVRGQIIIASNPALPRSKVSQRGQIARTLAFGTGSARLAAVGELAQLMSQDQDRSLTTFARSELERLSREDENLAVRGAAAGALGIFPAREERRTIVRWGEEIVERLVALYARTIFVREEAEEMEEKGLEKLQEQMRRLEDGISTMPDEEWKQVLQEAIKSAESLMEVKAVTRKGEEKIAQALISWISLAQTTVKWSITQ